MYCWSLLKFDIAESIGRGVADVEWAFSLAIFFLGISAAFSGGFVEKNVKRSSLIAAACFSLGMALTGVSLLFESLPGVYLSYGVLMGVGLGIGYISPVKTLMLWFSKNKGLATGLAITGFGLAKVIASPAIVVLNKNFGIISTFFILSATYFLLMMTAVFLIKKPDGYTEEHEKSKVSFFSLAKNRNFIAVWFILFLNISCGLALISQEKDLMKHIGLSIVAIGSLSSITAIFNSSGRFFYSVISDRLKKRSSIYSFMLLLSVSSLLLALATDSVTIGNAFIVVLLLCAINSTYGGGFSNLPTLLSDCFGMENISKIHGLSLTAWAMAGLFGNQLSSYVLAHTGSYTALFTVLLALYFAALLIPVFLLRIEGEKGWTTQPDPAQP